MGVDQLIILILNLSFIGIIILAILNYKQIKKTFKTIDKKTKIILLIIFLFGLFLRTAYAPHIPLRENGHQYKYIYDELIDGKELVFDLINDPMERTNIGIANEEIKKIKEKLMEYISKKGEINESSQDVSLSKENEEVIKNKLKELGYFD